MVAFKFACHFLVLEYKMYMTQNLHKVINQDPDQNLNNLDQEEFKRISILFFINY